MLLPVVAAVVGALLMGATKPRTAVEKKRALGSRSGVTYEVEEFPTAGFVVVRAPDGSEGILTRKLSPEVGFEWSRGRGRSETLQLLSKDFGVSLPGPNHVPNHKPT